MTNRNCNSKAMRGSVNKREERDGSSHQNVGKKEENGEKVPSRNGALKGKKRNEGTETLFFPEVNPGKIRPITR